ncbi:MAG: tryptophan synthase subunit alpha [Spirochaetaceae bacterium]|nr:tryptophan synthase subunit alpha [Spirochaetaceae bacterium]
MSRIMAHMVSFFPDRDRSMAVAEGLVAGGASYLEIQFPFSDPSADGPVIQAACRSALEAGFTVDEGFRFVAEVRRRCDVPIFIMTYASLVYARGVREFISAGRDAGALGFILPDLTFDHDEGVHEIAEELRTNVMPVIVTTMSPDRLRLLEQRPPGYLYVALRRGITGSRTELGAENLGFLDRLGPLGAKVMAGFGISERTQVEALDPHVHAAIVGSALVRTVADAAARTSDRTLRESADAIRTLLTEQVADLVGRS